MERLHLHIQQLQFELADVREKSGSNLDGSHISQTNLKDASEFGQSNGSQLDVNGNGSPSANSGSLQNGNAESVSGENTSTQVEYALPFLLCYLWCLRALLKILSYVSNEP